MIDSLKSVAQADDMTDGDASLGMIAVVFDRVPICHTHL